MKSLSHDNAGAERSFVFVLRSFTVANMFVLKERNVEGVHLINVSGGSDNRSDLTIKAAIQVREARTFEFLQPPFTS